MLRSYQHAHPWINIRPGLSPFAAPLGRRVTLSGPRAIQKTPVLLWFRFDSRDRRAQPPRDGGESPPGRVPLGCRDSGLSNGQNAIAGREDGLCGPRAGAGFKRRWSENRRTANPRQSEPRTSSTAVSANVVSLSANVVSLSANVVSLSANVVGFSLTNQRRSSHRASVACTRLSGHSG